MFQLMSSQQHTKPHWFKNKNNSLVIPVGCQGTQCFKVVNEWKESTIFPLSYTDYCCCSVAHSCLTLCSPVDCSSPGFPVLHYLPELAQTHVHLSQWCHPTILYRPFSSCPQSFPASGSFPMSWLFTSGGQRIGVSASVSVLPMNIQGWFPVGWTGLISLLSKGLSRVFSSTIIWKYQFFGTQPCLWSNSHICTWLLHVQPS